MKKKTNKKQTKQKHLVQMTVETNWSKMFIIIHSANSETNKDTFGASVS